MKSEQSPRVLIVDDHAMVAEALSQHLRQMPELEVVGTAHDGASAIEQAMTARPDIVVMDIDMPGIIAFDAAKRIGTMLPDCAIVFLSAFTHDRYIEQALAVRARGYLTKGESLERVREALLAIGAGGTFFSREVSNRLVVDGRGVRLANGEMTRLGALSDREMEVLRYVASSMTKKEIAKTMHLSVKTVENHCTNLMSKLDIHDRVELTRFAIREGLVAP